MPANRRRNLTRSAALATQAAELAFAAPQVVAHRVARMATAGARPSARDRKEFTGMVAEKQAAFFESWGAMAMQAAAAQQALAASWLKNCWALPGGKVPQGQAWAQQVQGAALGVLSKGLAPVHRKAVANAKRLARSKRR